MEKWIPYEKLSKKKQRELDAKKRGSWQGVNPVTRKTKNLKAYDRKKTRKWTDDPFSVSFVLEPSQENEIKPKSCFTDAVCPNAKAA